jgi:hypothetical protein
MLIGTKFGHANDRRNCRHYVWHTAVLSGIRRERQSKWFYMAGAMSLHCALQEAVNTLAVSTAAQLDRKLETVGPPRAQSIKDPKSHRTCRIMLRPEGELEVKN